MDACWVRVMGLPAPRRTAEMRKTIVDESRDGPDRPGEPQVPGQTDCVIGIVNRLLDLLAIAAAVDGRSGCTGWSIA